MPSFFPPSRLALRSLRRRFRFDLESFYNSLKPRPHSQPCSRSSTPHRIFHPNTKRAFRTRFFRNGFSQPLRSFARRGRLRRADLGGYGEPTEETPRNRNGPALCFIKATKLSFTEQGIAQPIPSMCTSFQTSRV